MGVMPYWVGIFLMSVPLLGEQRLCTPQQVQHMIQKTIVWESTPEYTSYIRWPIHTSKSGWMWVDVIEVLTPLGRSRKVAALGDEYRHVAYVQSQWSLHPDQNWSILYAIQTRECQQRLIQEHIQVPKNYNNNDPRYARFRTPITAGSYADRLLQTISSRSTFQGGKESF